MNITVRFMLFLAIGILLSLACSKSSVKSSQSSSLVITKHPESQTANPYESVIFLVEASSLITPDPDEDKKSSILRYQWKKNGVDIPDGTLPAYNLHDIQESDEGTYSCVVTDGIYTIESDAAFLTVRDLSIIVAQPQDQTKNIGEPATFAVIVARSDSVTYQWQKNGAPISGAISSVYTIASVAQDDCGYYSCVIENEAGQVSSQTAILETPYYVISPARITSVPVAYGRYGIFAVSSPEEKMVRFFDNPGVSVAKISLPFPPLGIVIKAGGEILIGNVESKSIDVYSLDGVYIRSFANGVIANAMAISVANNFLFVSDTQNGVVKLYDLQAETLIRDIGTPGTNPGQFRTPTGVAIIEATQQIIVGDFFNKRLQVFDFQGVYIKSITKTTDPKLDRPQGVALDSSGNIYVADGLWPHVYVFDPAGVFLKTVGGYGSSSGQLKNPMDVILKSDGELWVVNTNNHRIEVFSAKDVQTGTIDPGYVHGDNTADMNEQPLTRYDMEKSRGDGMHYKGDTTLCLDCHRNHWSAGTIGPLIPDTTGSIENFCSQSGCHNVGGKPNPKVHKSSRPRMSSPIACTICHNPHRQDCLPNIKNIRKLWFRNTPKTQYCLNPTTVDRTVDYTQSNHFTKGDGSGLCEICHQDTLYHKQTGTAWNHHSYADSASLGSLRKTSMPTCTACHRHNDGTAPGNGFYKETTQTECNGCHNADIANASLPKGKRRRLDTELTGAASQHQHIAGKAFNAITSGTCTVCHDNSKHRQGKVRLRNVDTSLNDTTYESKIVTFVQFQPNAAVKPHAQDATIKRDQYDAGWVPGEVTQNDVMNNFCQICHDSNGANIADVYHLSSTVATAATNLKPFNTNTVVNVYSQFDPNNATNGYKVYHPVVQYRNNPYCKSTPTPATLVAYYGGLKNASPKRPINCWDCHDIVHGSNLGDMLWMETFPDAPVENNTTYISNSITFCDKCHSPSTYDYTSGNGSGSAMPKHGSDSNHSKTNTHMGCRSCHCGLISRTSNASYAPNAPQTNGTYKGNIHGYFFNFKVPASPVSKSDHFVVGGYFDTWKDDGGGRDNGNGACYGGLCQHPYPGSAKTY